MAQTIFTLGYAKYTIKEYTNILKESGITTLIDVREKAWSRKRDFCKTRFETYLQKNGIRYLHLPKAGNPSSIRKSSKNIDQVLMKYNKYLLKHEEALTEILNEVNNGKPDKKEVICLTCVEDDYNTCHRSVIVNQLKNRSRSLRIRHL